MDTFTKSLSYDEQTVILYNNAEQSIVPRENINNTEQGIVPYEGATKLVNLSETKETLTTLRTFLSSELPRVPLTPNPLIVADRNRALQTLGTLLSTARSIRQKFEESLFFGPACPYQRTLIEYLGPKFLCPSIKDLAFPITFNPPEVIKTITTIDKKYNDLMFTHLQIMSAEAADTNFVGITSQNLGNAFAILSATPNGQEYVIDKNKAAQHLEFVEMIRNIPADYILRNPTEVAQKLVGRYIEIHSD